MHPQIYLLLSCCPCEGRVSGIVDVPNACCTLAIPTAIFDQARLYTLKQRPKPRLCMRPRQSQSTTTDKPCIAATLSSKSGSLRNAHCALAIPTAIFDQAQP